MGDNKAHEPEFPGWENMAVNEIIGLLPDLADIVDDARDAAYDVLCSVLSLEDPHALADRLMQRLLFRELSALLDPRGTDAAGALALADEFNLWLTIYEAGYRLVKVQAEEAAP